MNEGTILTEHLSREAHCPPPQRCGKHDIGRSAGNFYLKISAGGLGKKQDLSPEDTKKRADGPSSQQRPVDCREDRLPQCKGRF